MVKLVDQFDETGEGMVKLVDLLSEGFLQNVNLGFRLILLKIQCGPALILNW